MYPKDYRYTKEHEWIKVDGAIGTVGITDYAQHELGDVVFVELPKVGTQLKARAIARHGGIGEGCERNLHARERRSDGDESRARRCSGKNQFRSARRGVARQDAAGRSERSRRP